MRPQPPERAVEVEVEVDGGGGGGEVEGGEMGVRRKMKMVLDNRLTWT